MQRRGRADDDGVGDQRDLVGGHAGALGLLADLLGARALVEADGAELAGFLLDHVGADPADVVGHLLADFGGAGGGLLELLGGAPEVAAANGVEVHAAMKLPAAAARASVKVPYFASPMP